MKRTLLAVGIAVLVSMMFVPCDRYGFYFWRGPQPFWICIDGLTPYQWQVMWPKLVLQTVFLAVLFAIIVNLLPRRK